MIKRDKLILQTKTLNDGGVSQNQLPFNPAFFGCFINLQEEFLVKIIL